MVEGGFQDKITMWFSNVIATSNIAAGNSLKLSNLMFLELILVL